MNILTLLELVADAAPDRVAVGSLEAGLTYSDLLERARAAGARVASLGVDRLVAIDVNSAAIPVALFAAAAAGVPFVPINYRLADDQLQAVLGQIGPAVAVVHPSIPARVEPTVTDIKFVEAADLLATRTVHGGSPEPDPEGVALLLFTSGTTGAPKAAVLRHRHLTGYILSSVDFLAAETSDAALVSVPPYHIAGVSAVLSSVWLGRRIVYLSQFDPQEWVTTAASEAITHAMVVPTMLGRILDVIERDEVALPALRHLSYGGGRMPVPVLERAMAALPEVGFVNAYGLTETSSTVSVLTPDDHRTAFAATDEAVRARLGSVGRPLPGIELQIRDSAGFVLDPGVSGEVWVRGDQVSGEYLSHGEPALMDGWFATKDGGLLDDEGYLFVEGRLDDVIVRGGENLSPGEIEDILVAHHDVAEAAVFGVPDDEWGEIVAAVVVLVPDAATDADTLKAWVQAHLRSTRVPSHVRFTDELPYSETGKLLRRVLRADFLETVGAQRA